MSDSDRSEIQDLVYGVSHDMGAPVRALKQFSGLLKGRLEGKVDEKELKWLSMMEGEANRLQDMLNSLLVYSRLETQPSPLGQIDPMAILEQIHQTDFPLLKLEVSGNFPADFEGRPHLWEMVFTQLLSNASVHVSVDASVFVDVTTDTDGEVTLSISDSGEGVSEENLVNLGRPFLRLASREVPGLGMGLALASRAVTLMGGQIGFHDSSSSEKSSGLQVDISL